MMNRPKILALAAAALALLCAAPPATAQAWQPASFNLRSLEGLPVYATTPGRVLFAGYRKGDGIIDIDHGDGLSTHYAHLNRILVQPGQTVTQHQLIGLINDTGWNMWPRLVNEASVTR